MSDGRMEFGFRPDWRAEIPFALLPVKVGLWVGAPIWLLWFEWSTVGGWLVPLLVWAMIGAGGAEQSIRRAVQYRRKLRDGRIVLTEKTARLPAVGDRWKRVAWKKIRQVSIVRVGGLLGEGILRVQTDDGWLSVPGYVLDRRVLVRELTRRAGFDRKSEGRWARSWWQGGRRP